MTKMTDEALDEGLRHVAAALGHGVADEFRAHIAALTAERDERESFGWRQATECIAGRSYSATCSMEALAAAHAVAAEVQFLRERVKALEGELAAERNCYNKQYDRANAAERHLAAIRQRVEEARDLLGESSDNATKAWRLLDLGLSVDAPAPVSELDGMQGEMADARCKHGLDNPSVCAVCEDDAEPTTSEAFAAVRRGWQAMEALEVPAGHVGDEESGQHDEDCALCAHEALLAWSEDAEHALSLLERRMRAKDAALRYALTLHHRMPGDVTLDEVATALERNAIPAPVQVAIFRTLESLRR